MVKMLVMDVDGTLTDGKIYMSANGEVMKAFDIKDGYAIRDVLPRHEIVPVIITGRISSIVQYRAEELGINHIYQGVKDKAKILHVISEKMEFRMDEIACIGDDLLDLPMIELCGVSGCPKDATQIVKEKCDYICMNKGGYGAVREFIEWLIRMDKKKML